MSRMKKEKDEDLSDWGIENRERYGDCCEVNYELIFKDKKKALSAQAKEIKKKILDLGFYEIEIADVKCGVSDIKKIIDILNKFVGDE